MLPSKNKDLTFDIAVAGDHELLAPDHPHHVILPGGELQGREEATEELHGGVPGGKYLVGWVFANAGIW